MGRGIETGVPLTRHIVSTAQTPLTFVDRLSLSLSFPKYPAQDLANAIAESSRLINRQTAKSLEKRAKGCYKDPRRYSSKSPLHVGQETPIWQK